MVIAVERLLIRVRQPRSRADELIALRRRLRDERAREIGPEERALAEEVRARKLAVAAELRGVASCATCATGEAASHGGYVGGACCSGVTAELFGDHELAALAHAGTRPGDLAPPGGGDAHAGCAFRGPRGCTLDVAHRPGRCVHYLCGTLQRELFQRGQLDALEAKLTALSGAMQRFVAVHQAGVDRDVVTPILDAIAAAARDA